MRQYGQLTYIHTYLAQTLALALGLHNAVSHEVILAYNKQKSKKPIKAERETWREERGGERS